MFYLDDDLRVKDLKVDNKGIFHYINEIKPIPFTNLIDVKTLDLGFEMLHGEKVISQFVKSRFKDEIKENTMIDLAEIIVSMFGSKWDIMISIYENDLDLESYKLVTTEQVDETGNVTNLKEDISSSERENQVSAFDSENYSNEGKEINSGNTTISDSGENTNLKNVTRTVQGSLSNKLDDIEKVKSILHKNILNDIIYIDVIQLVGLSIY